MSQIDFILNIVGLLLWLNWRAAESPLKTRPAARSLTLRSAGPPKPQYHYWTALPLLLLARAVFYWQAGPPNRWNPQLPLGPLSLSFRSDLFGRMVLFSALSFCVALGVFYLWLLVISTVNSRVPDTDPVQQLVRTWLGRLERWPTVIKPIIPTVVAMAVWCAIYPLLTRLGLAPANAWGRIVGQGAVIGLSGYLTLKFVAMAILALHLFNSYVYLGEFPLWKFVNATARQLLRPLQWLPLRVWRIDLAPLVAMALVWVAAEFAGRGLGRLYQNLL